MRKTYMSRNWTPQEMYNVDKSVNNRIRNTELYFVRPDGTQVPMESEQARMVRKQYKELGFLFDNLPSTYERLKEHPKYRNRVLREIEYRLERYEIHNIGDENDPLWLWYIGRLDPSFYYSEENNRLLAEYIIGEVQKLVNKR